MTTTELAQRLYEKWRQGQDFYNPQSEPDVIFVDELGEEMASDEGVAWKPRPKWDHLDTMQQNVWRAVAIEAKSVTEVPVG